MKPYFYKIGLVLFGAILGGGLVFLLQNRTDPQAELIQDLRDDPFAALNDDFFSESNPFEQMRKMQEQLKGGLVSSIGSEISEREDDHYIYFDIKAQDLNLTNISTKVENGYVTVSGVLEKKSGSDSEADSQSFESHFKSTFNRTFPLPDHVIGEKMEMIQEKDKVVLRFPKVKS